MSFPATLVYSVGAVAWLILALTSPDFLMGGRGGKGAILTIIALIATFAISSYADNPPGTSPVSPHLHRTRRRNGSLLALVAMAMVPLGALLWLWERSQGIVLTTIGAPGMFFGAWALALWWRNRRLEANLCEISHACRMHDPVTGLLSHHSIHTALQEAFCQAVQQKRPLSVMRVDIDRFTLYNNTYGPSAGDELLRRMGQVVAQFPPSGAAAGRYDADEFLIILPNVERQQAITIAHRLREQIRQSPLAHAGNGQAISIMASIGIACYPDDAESVQSLLSAAGETLNEAKRSGSGIADTYASWRTRYHIHEDGDFSTLEAMVVAIDNKDHYTRLHSEEVTEYALWVAEELGLTEEQKHALRLASLVHDVGKIGIPDEVLLKPDGLTPGEYEMIKQHAVLGAVMLAALPNMEHIAPVVRWHHERWDGKGYPDGLVGEQIPLLARVLAVADAFSAMTTDRPYRKGMDWGTALAEIERQRGKQFDPAIADALISAVRKHIQSAQAEPITLPQAA